MHRGDAGDIPTISSGWAPTETEPVKIRYPLFYHFIEALDNIIEKNIQKKLWKIH